MVCLSGFSQYQIITPLTPLTTPTGSTTSLSMTNPKSPAGPGTITVYYQGDFDSGTETGDLFDENGTLIGTTASGVTQCSATLDSVKFPVTVSQISTWVADGVINFDFTITTAVNPTLCSSTGDNVQVKLEYAPVTGPNDIGIANIGIGTGAVFCSGSQAVTATLSNAGTNQVTSARIGWELNGVPQAQVNFSGLLDTLGGLGSQTAVVSLGNVTFNPGVTSIKVYSSQPNGVADTSNLNDTNIRVAGPSLSGTFTLNSANPTSGTNFNSFTDLNNTLSSLGICGPVVVNVSPGIYTENLLMGAVAGASSTNTLTIDGGNSSTTTVDGSSGFYALALNGASYTTIRNMSFINNSTSSMTVLIGNNSKHNTIESCVAKCLLTSTSSLVNAMGTSSSLTTRSTNGVGIDSNTIINNRIVGGYYGVYFYGTNNNAIVGNKILNNQIDSAYYYGIYNYYTQGTEVIGNTVDMTTRSNINADGYYSFVSFDGTVAANNIHAPDYAFYLSNGNATANAKTKKSEIYNNMLISDADYGMYLYSVDSVNVYHNSVVTLGSFSYKFSCIYIWGKIIRIQ